MLLALTSGLGLWIVYGVIKSDWVLTSANVVGALLAGAVLFFKIRDKFSHRRAMIFLVINMANVSQRGSPTCIIL